MGGEMAQEVQASRPWDPAQAALDSQPETPDTWLQQ